MDYIQYLRSKVGHDPIILVGSYMFYYLENVKHIKVRKDNIIDKLSSVTGRL